MLMLLESLGFLPAAAKALVDEQLFNRWATLWELDKDTIVEAIIGKLAVLTLE